jgi:hypothetical protein
MGGRFLAVVCIGLGLWVVAAPIHAQEAAGTDPFGSPAEESAAVAPAHASPAQAAREAAEVRIEQALDQPLRSPLDFIDTPLNSVMQVLAEEYQIPIQFDIRAMEEIALSPEAEVTVNLREITLRSALELMLQSVEGLTYIVDREVLLITSEDRAASRLIVRIYRIDDLQSARIKLPAPDEHESGAAIVPPAVGDVVRRFVASDTWAESGRGEGQIAEWPGLLIVSNTARVHREVDELFSRLRSVSGQLRGAGDAHSADRRHAVAEAPAAENPFE